MKSLSTRQSIIILTFAILSTKIQRFPALLSQEFGNMGWLFVLLGLVIDLPFVLIALRISSLTKGKTVFQALSLRCGKPIAIAFAIIGSLFLVIKMGAPYKGTHEFFISAIFDNLNWEWFSLLFVVFLIVVAAGELNRIGRTAEILWLFAIIGFVGMTVLGSLTASFSNLLPISNIAAKSLFKGIKIFNQWTTDFVIILFFIGRVKENKFKTAIISTYVITLLFSCFFCTIFYANFSHLSTIPDVAISAVIEFSLLGVSLGRIDWFLALLSMSSSVLTLGFFACAATECFCDATTLPKKYVAIALGSICYFLDTKIFTSPAIFVNYYTNYITYFVLATNYVVIPLIWLLLELTKNKTTSKCVLYRVHKKSLQELRLKMWTSLKRRRKC